MIYAPLSVGNSEFDVGPEGPTFAFDTGKSFFKAFVLPERNGPLKVQVTTFSNRLVGGYFQPDILLLDQNKKVSLHLEAPLLKIPAEVSGVFQLSKSTSINIPAGPNYSFMIIRTTDDLLRTVELLQEKATLQPGVTFDVQGRVINWPAGKVGLDISM